MLSQYYFDIIFFVFIFWNLKWESKTFTSDFVIIQFKGEIDVEDGSRERTI